MRRFLPSAVVLLLGLGALPACTVNYYVPDATAAGATPQGPRRMPPRRWQPAPPPGYGYGPAYPQPMPGSQPGPVRQPAPPIRQYPPVATTPAPQPSHTPGGPRHTPGTPGPAPHPSTPPPTTHAPAPQPSPAPHNPAPAPHPTTPPAPAPSPAPAPGSPAPAPHYPYPTGGIKPMKTVQDAPVVQPTPVAPTSMPTGETIYPYPTGGIKPAKESTNTPAAPAPETLPDTKITRAPADAPVQTSPQPGGIRVVESVSESPSGPAVADELVLVTNGAEQAANPVLVFERTPCFGTCPHYTARFFADGRVAYEGFRYAPVEGKRDLKVAPATIQSILREADLIGFRKLEKNYASGATDMPATSLTIRYADGTTKAVRAEDMAPVELKNLFALLNAEVEKALGVSAEK